MKTYVHFLAALFCMGLASGSYAEKIKLGVTWSGKSGMTKRVIQGFDEGMKAHLSKFDIEYQKELSKEKMDEVVKRFQKEKKGMLVLRSSGAKYLAKNTPTIPAFVGGCNHPTELGAIKNVEKPEGNITGVSYFLELTNPFDIFQAIKPDMKSLVLIGENGHPSSLVDKKGVEEQCKKRGLTCSFELVKNKDELGKVTGKYAGKVDVVLLGNQAKVFDNAAAVAAKAPKTAIFSLSDKPVEEGALVGFVADDVKLGRMLAESVVDVLANGKKIADVPVKFDPKPKFKINTAAAKKLGLEIPLEVIEAATLIGH